MSAPPSRTLAPTLVLVLVPGLLALAAAGCATTDTVSESAPAVGRVTGPLPPAPVAAAPSPPIILTPPVRTPPPPVGLPNPPVPTPPPAPVRPPLALPLDGPRSLEQATTKPAVLALYRQAQAEQQAGQLDQASATLERALGLDARNGWLYQALAQVNLTARRPDLAQGQARKALSLAHRNPFLELQSLRTLQAALSRLGQVAEAAAAAARAEGLAARIRAAGGPV